MNIHDATSGNVVVLYYSKEYNVYVYVCSAYIDQRVIRYA